MAKPEDIRHFAEIEYCISRYFNCHIRPIMKSEQDALHEAQVKEISEYSRSFAGFMRSFANAMNNQPDDTLLYLRAAGKECSKKSEDYILACNRRITGDRDIQADIQRIACDWRTAVVNEIGRERYDELSGKLGGDLALAYIDHRIQQMMVDRMIAEKMPKSSFDYIIQKGVSGSLFGLAYEVDKSPLDREIEERGEAAYNPSSLEKAAAKGISIGSDAVALGGIYSWASLARFAGTEVVFTGLEAVLDKDTPEGVSVEEVISRAVFGDGANRFTTFRRESLKIKEYENPYLQDINAGFSKKMSLMTEKPLFEPNWEFDFTKPFDYHSQGLPFNTAGIFATPDKPAQTQRNPSVPLVIAPGHEQEYIEFLENTKHGNMTYMNQDNQAAETPGETAVETTSENVSTHAGAESVAESEVHPQETDETNDDRWSGLLQSFGLDGLGDVGRNLPYVIAMLPDMLVGLLTGKTQSIGLRKDMIPIASILMGMFVSNPLLKMVLIGMGGANLFNKVGHEVIGRENGERSRIPQYLQYADQELNPRICNPVLRGNIMVATIDGVPCSVTIPDNAAAAVEAGALPLNTLANAILARHDSMRDNGRDSTRSIDMDTTIVRDRGITR